MMDTEASVRGRVLADIMAHFTNDFAIGKKMKTGELQKRAREGSWMVPDCFRMMHIDMGRFSMKMLSSKILPNPEKVVLQFHGGGYNGMIRNKYYVAAGLYNEVSHGCSVLSPDYRVAPEDPYPAALEDALSSYEWLMAHGYGSEQIVLAGDSAGGGLAIALCMYLRDHGMPLPCGIVGMSPWADLTASGESYETNFFNDPLFGNTRDSLIFINDYPGDHDPAEPYISPIFGDFTDFPPMLLQVGSIEMLLSDSMTIAEKAKAAGVKVRLSVYEGMFHEFQMAFLTIPESKRAWEEVGKFFNLLMQGEHEEN